MTISTIICLLGNVACGKTTLCQIINSTNINKGDTCCIAVERDSSFNVKYDIDFNLIDQLLLEYPFDEDNFNQVILNDTTENGEKIYWIILDTNIDTILTRIESQSKGDLYHTRKSLYYFQQRFRHLGSHFGIPIIDTTYKTFAEIHQEILDIVNKYSHYYQYYRQVRTQILNYDIIQKFDIENELYRTITFDSFHQIDDLPEYSDELSHVDKHKLYVRWYLNANSIKIDEQEQILKIGIYQIHIKNPIFQLVNEGESKKIYKDISGNPFTKNLAFIILKSTIYSHSMQITGEINSLGSIRACGSQLFVEMMWRNGVKHSYRSINSNGIIISDFIEQIPPIEIVVKRFCEGTDKNAFHDILLNEHIVLPNTYGEYSSGPYVRFDWRNPNHISPRTKEALNKNPYYYIYEQAIGKEEFFNKILFNKKYSLPIGDKNITEDLLTNVINIKQTKLSVLKMFMIIQSYFSQVNLAIKDVCFMLDKSGQVFWSEINQDCMRITINNDFNNKFDKDIWRIGGSKSRSEISKKWKDFNEIFMEYFYRNKFYCTEVYNYNSYMYQNEIRKLLKNYSLKIPSNLKELWLNLLPKNPRRVLVTMDLYDQQPVLVKSSQIYEIHSDGSYQKAMEKVSLFPDILIVDLNRAFDPENKINQSIISDLARNYYVHTGGGLRSLDDINQMLKSGIRRCVVASGENNLIESIPKDRLIVELSISEQNQVLINARQTNTQIDIIDRIYELIKLNVNVISITFVKSEGHLLGLPRQQISNIIYQIPYAIKKIYIAGGISTIDDLEYLWSFDRVIPMLGSVIWKNRLSVANIFNQMIHFNEQNLCPAIIQDKNGLVKGLCYINDQSIEKICEERLLYRYSRKFDQMIMKGQTSNDIQRIIKLSVDCDSDSILITVDSAKPFCHTGNYSCFSLQTPTKINISTLTEYLQTKMNTNSYTGQMQKYPQLALMKIFEEFWEIVASHQHNEIFECSDLLVHFLMYLNGRNIMFDDILNELNIRRWKPKEIKLNERSIDEIIIGITNSKYTHKTDEFAENQLGIKIIRNSGRNFLVRHEIVDKNKFCKYFGQENHIRLSFLPAKPKDLVQLLASKRITHIITFETLIKNYPKVYSIVHEIIDPTISLALISRKNEFIDPKQWSEENKILIAAEHICQLTGFFETNSIDYRTYHLDHISGSSESFLVNSNKYLLADAIVETTRTIHENNLQIWKTIIPNGYINIGLYQCLS